MPVGNARIGDANQEAPSRPRFDINTPKGLARFVNAFAAMLMMRELPEGDERDNAVEHSVAFLNSHDLRWIEIIEGWAKSRRGDDDAAAQATIAHLLTQIAALQAEIDQLRAERAASTSVALWSAVDAKIDDHRIVARWALDLGTSGRVWLAAFEVDFLTTCARWTGSLTAKQKPVYLQIIDRVVAKTGLRPPTS